jgi:hypothetical protein
MGKKEVQKRFCWGNLREGDSLEDQGGDEGIILKGIFKRGMGHGLDLSDSG